MSDEWRGLHNPDLHEVRGSGAAECKEESEAAWCIPERLCRCCLEAEVETLRPLRIKNAALAADNALLRSQLRKMEELHVSTDEECSCCEPSCDQCDDPMPCATKRILDNDDSDE